MSRIVWARHATGISGFGGGSGNGSDGGSSGGGGGGDVGGREARRGAAAKGRDGCHKYCGRLRISWWRMVQSRSNGTADDGCVCPRASIRAKFRNNGSAAAEVGVEVGVKVVAAAAAV